MWELKMYSGGSVPVYILRGGLFIYMVYFERVRLDIQI